MSPKKKKLDSHKESQKENRVDGQRVPIQLLVDYKADGSYLFDFCRDLGGGGVFIETMKPEAQGSELDLTFTLPDSKETLFVKGKVIWVQNKIPDKDVIPGMGVQFIAFEAEDRETLENFVKRYSDDYSRSA